MVKECTKTDPLSDYHKFCKGCEPPVYKEAVTRHMETTVFRLRTNRLTELQECRYRFGREHRNMPTLRRRGRDSKTLPSEMSEVGINQEEMGNIQIRPFWRPRQNHRIHNRHRFLSIPIADQYKNKNRVA